MIARRYSAKAKAQPSRSRLIVAVAAGILAVVAALACAGSDEDSTAQPVADLTQPDVKDLSQWDKGDWDKAEFQDKDTDKSDFVDGDVTTTLANESGGAVSYIEHPAREEPAILIAPSDFVDGETPLIVSLHGFGGNAAFQAALFPIHKRVNSDGFAVLLPNGALDAQGSRFWNPTGEYGGKSGGDDVAYLTELVAEARKARNLGHIYFFGYSNGGFMANHVACKGLPGLRAVASLAGTSYVEESNCRDAPPVSALHIHGTEDSAILFDGARSEPDPNKGGETAFYLGAHEIAARRSRKAGCDWSPDAQPQSTLDLDLSAPGAETQVFRPQSACVGGISVELWVSEGSGHAPDYGNAFTDALLDWLLAQQ